MSGSNAVEAQLNEAIKSFEREFDTSPSFHQVDIDGVVVDTIINKTNRHDEKLVNFRHGYKPEVGSVIRFKDDDYLLMEKDEDEIYRFGTMKRCNYNITIDTGTERVFDGFDHRGAPQYITIPNEKKVPVIITSKYYSSNDNAQLPLPEGKISMFMKYVSDSYIEINKEFTIFDRLYEVADVNLTEVIKENGIKEVVLERKVSTA